MTLKSAVTAIAVFEFVVIGAAVIGPWIAGQILQAVLTGVGSLLSPMILMYGARAEVNEQKQNFPIQETAEIAEIDSAPRLDELDLRAPLLLDMLHALPDRQRHRPHRVHGLHHPRVHRVEHALHLLLLRHQPLSRRIGPGKHD